MACLKGLLAALPIFPDFDRKQARRRRYIEGLARRDD